MTTTDGVETGPDSGYVRRYGPLGRWFHAGVYLTVLVLLGTGWWFVVGGYHRPSPVARLIGQPDATVHELTGYALTLIVVVWLPFGVRGARAFVSESLRFRRGDGRWLAGWPRAAFTGRFGDHDGHFDPGQRLANIVIVLFLALLVVTGLVALLAPALNVGVEVIDVHRWATFAVTPVLLGHIVVAAGVLPGYRGVWRSMHLGGRLPVAVARRIWPRWLAAVSASDDVRARRARHGGRRQPD